MKTLTIMSIALFVILLAACTPMMPARNQTTNKTTEPVANETITETPETPANETEVKQAEEPPVDTRDLPIKEVVEGETVSFPNLKAVDPDGDKIEYTFSAPLDNRGRWETKEGDAGDHIVTITASDGTNTVSQKVLIRVNPKNKAPVIEITDPVEAEEGQTITLEPTITDPEGDEVTVTYSGWMNSSTKELGYDDSGNHKVIITATDGKATAAKEFIVSVKNVNRAPELADLEAVTIKEGQKAYIKASAEDPDGDNVTYSYDFPFSETGAWQTEIGDAGEYDVVVKASDGELTAEKTAHITIEAVNKAPEIVLESPITVSEGDTVTLNPEITDPEGDEFRVSYSGWMNSNTKTTGYDDQGDHIVTITARDTAGNEAKLDVKIVVNDVNRPPIFGAGSFS
ncbi:Cadherin-like protein [uncultured archaeon]|nr:Cadherin-like protein [uncultured archaeon]